MRWISRSGFLFQIVILILVAGLMWFPALMNPSPPISMQAQGPFYIILFDYVSHSPLLNRITLVIIVLASAFLLNYTLRNNNLIPRKSFVIPILFVAIAGWHPDLLRVSPVLCTVPFLVLALTMLMSIYNNTESQRNVLSAGLSIGLATLFYYPAIVFIVFCWAALLTLRISSWREWIIVLIGLVLPLIYFLSWLYISDRWNAFMLQTSHIHILALADFSSLPAYVLAWLIILLALQILILLTVLPGMNDKLISIRRKSWIVADMSILAISVILVIVELQPVFTFYLALTLSALIALALTTKRWSAFYDYLSMALIILSFFMQFYIRL